MFVGHTERDILRDSALSRSQGLLRTVLANYGLAAFPEAFANLGLLPHMGRIVHHPKRDLTGARILVPSEDGEGYWDLTRIGTDIFVVITNVNYKAPRDELIPGEGFVNFLFKISGDMVLAMDSAEPLRWNRPSLLIWSQPVGIDCRDWMAPKTRERYIAICVRPEYLREHFFIDGREVPQPLRALLFNRNEKVLYCQRPLDAQAFEHATRLINNPYTGALALIHTEAIVFELLCGALGGPSLASGYSIDQYTERDLKCLHEAREMLMKQLAPVPTIDELAHSVGMSKSALTEGFKSLFRETVFEFSLHCRMTHALTLMRDKGWSVERASAAVGYAHPTSFATAFRRYFDVRPIDLRRRKVRQPTSR